MDVRLNEEMFSFMRTGVEKFICLHKLLPELSKFMACLNQTEATTVNDGPAEAAKKLLDIDLDEFKCTEDSDRTVRPLSVGSK
jgi:hypothetical protein